MPQEPDLTAILPYLMSVAEHGASDLHIKVGSPPRIRISGALTPLDVPALTFDEAENMIIATMDETTKGAFLRTNEADYAISAHGVGRFRANAYRSRGGAAAILRRVGDEPATLESLGLPPVISKLAMESRGLVLVTGPTGSGKTTTLAGMVNLINENKPVHILTIEDPIEVMHRDKRASVSQRELRTDTADWSSALRAAMREDPDVILIGEMRDEVTVSSAVAAAETGHFVMSTLHTTDAAETINRVIDFYQPHEQKQIRAALSQSLKGIICQRLVPKVGGGRVVCMEILVSTERIADAILDPDKTGDIPDLIAEGGYYGMQTFDAHLVRLVLEGTVSVADARGFATNVSDFELKLKQNGLDRSALER